jgi:lysophospholipase L1-like esterase
VTKRLLICALTAILASIGLVIQARPAAAAGPVYAPPGKYYLSLGDSLAFGYQQIKVPAAAAATSPEADAATFNTGYTDDFYRMLQAIDPGIQLVNYACPGETSTQFISSAGCPSFPFPLHNSFAGSQLQAALAFIQAHPGQVSPITLDLGANDIEQLLTKCGGLGHLECVAPALPGAVTALGKNVGQVLGALRQAAPNAEIIVTGLYNPYAAVDATTNALAKPVNDAIAQAAAATGAIAVDAFTSFNLAPAEPQTVCTLTFFCGSLHDIHPTDAGYLTMAKLIWDASGYAKYAHGFMVTWYGTAGTGEVYFGSGPGCTGLVEVATRDLQPAGSTTHIVYVTGNDLPGTVGDIGIVPGVKYQYEAVTVGSGGGTTDNNGGKCYTGMLPAS